MAKKKTPASRRETTNKRKPNSKKTRDKPNNRQTLTNTLNQRLTQEEKDQAINALATGEHTPLSWAAQSRKPITQIVNLIYQLPSLNSNTTCQQCGGQTTPEGQCPYCINWALLTKSVDEWFDDLFGPTPNPDDTPGNTP